jgi:hypothetical protein
MRSLTVSGALALLGACGEVPISASDAAMDSASGGDANTSDGSSARCDSTKPFGTPTLLANVNTSNEETAFSFTRDEHIAFVGRVVQGPPSSATIVLAERASREVDFPTPASTLTAAINNVAGFEYAPSSVADGLILYFHRYTAEAITIYAATRPDNVSSFSEGTSISVDGTGLQNALSPTISADGQTLYWLDYNDFKMRSAKRGNTPTIFTNVRVASTMDLSHSPVLSADELTLYYSQGNGVDVLESTRASTSEMFGTGVPVANVNSAMDDSPVAVSSDGCVLYISSARSGGVGGRDIWQARRPK